MEVKICGLTRPEEAAYLNEAGADYAGFVFFEKSRRNLTIEQADTIKALLNPTIRRVAVTVSPDAKLALALEAAGFDVLQVHKELSRQVLEAVHIPIWYAFNIGKEEELLEKQHFLEELPEHLADKITAVVVDGAEYGSGKTFDWTDAEQIREKQKIFWDNRKFVLAGGLNPENVSEAIRIFQPDIVDVSSGVEGSNGKDKQKIYRFIEAVKETKGIRP